MYDWHGNGRLRGQIETLLTKLKSPWKGITSGCHRKCFNAYFIAENGSWFQLREHIAFNEPKNIEICLLMFSTVNNIIFKNQTEKIFIYTKLYL